MSTIARDRWICGQSCGPAGVPWITKRPLSTAPASVHKLHRPASQFEEVLPTQSAGSHAEQIAGTEKRAEMTLATSTENR